MHLLLLLLGVVTFGGSSAGGLTNDPVTVPLTVTSDVEGVVAFSFSMNVPADLTVVSVSPGSSLSGEESFHTQMVPGGFTVGCIVDFSPPFSNVPVGTSEIVSIVCQSATSGNYTLSYSGDLGSPEVVLEVVLDSLVAEVPSTASVDVTIGSRPFVRGDVTGDSVTTISDAVLLLMRLFGEQAAGICADAEDVNDDGSVNLTDAVFLLDYMFVGGAMIPPPFPACAVDATGDSLADCEGYLCP